MNVWYHSTTIFNQRRVLQIAGLLTLCVAFITMLFFSVVTHAAPGVNQTISFQGRLLTPQGQPVPEGYYNIQFKIYQDGTGKVAGNPGGSLEWTETYINDGGNNAVHVKNGYFSVELGSLNPFGNQVDWNQDTLWLSMNIAGSSSICSTFGTAPCLADGEMLPMKRLTSSPYAMNAGKLEGKSASDFIQNGTTQQTGNFNISGTGIANTLQGTTSIISPNFDTTSSGTLSLGSTNASAITIGSVGTEQTINIGTSDDTTKTIDIGSTFGNSYTRIQAGNMGIRLESKGGIGLRNANSNVNSLLVSQSGNVSVNLATGNGFSIRNSNDRAILSVQNDSNTIETDDSTQLNVKGSATFYNGINIQGTSTYRTPGGYNMNSAINIDNYTVGQHSSIFAFGLPADSAATARGMLVADARTGNHQATIGILSVDENNILGFSYHGSATKGYVTNTGDTIALQGNSLDILTATNAGGQARVGIGNNATSGYALDVTGSTNVSDNYAINGVNVLNNTGLNFTGASTASINAASGQALQLTGSSVKIGDGTASGDATLLTLDKGATAPAATGDAVLGSMYYDTTKGKVQCYEADGWGACSSSPDNFVTLSPEYTNAVTNGSGIGEMKSDICSDTLNINDGSSSQPTICGTNETYNFYNWTSPEATAQTKDIYVTYQLPANFTGFVEGSTSLVGRTDSDDATTAYRVYKNTASGLVACGSLVTVSNGTQTSWQKVTATGSADPANCNFSANDSIVFKISLSAQTDTNAYASTLSFAFRDN
jgi:hypothetical protein